MFLGLQNKIISLIQFYKIINFVQMCLFHIKESETAEMDADMLTVM